MTNLELIEKAKKVLDMPTLYVTGGQGQPLTQANKNSFISKYKNNQSANRKTKILNATNNTFAFDCNGVIKSLCWGFVGDVTKVRGGAIYASNGFPDISEDVIITKCNPSTDFKSIVPGAVVWLKGHIGIYIGDNLVIESTPSWKDGVQITNLGNLKAYRAGYNTRIWTKWGKLPYIDYMIKRDLVLRDKRGGKNKKIVIEDNYLIDDANHTGVAKVLQGLNIPYTYDAPTKEIIIHD